ncbi:MAG: PIN domain-containing protein [Verrucomicrobiota bacterium]
MTASRTINLFRVLFITFALFLGSRIGDVLFESTGSQWIGAVSGLIFGLAIVLIDRLLKGFSLRMFSSATFGMLLGFFAARLLLASDVLRYSPPQTRWIASVAIYAALAYLGTMLALRSSRDEFSLIIPYVRFRRVAIHDEPIVVDTSALIDGRILRVSETGFLSTSLVVPSFVLDELQALGDSSDPLKRERGRRGLDLLQEIQRRPDMTVTIHESVPEGDQPVDTRLMQVSQIVQARLLTNDSNLARIARLQGISVLNLHDLARALQPALTTGEELDLTLVKPGREPHQAVGYLQDGSMIIVNHARPFIGEVQTITIAGTHQTGAGKLYFAELKHPSQTRPAL